MVAVLSCAAGVGKGVGLEVLQTIPATLLQARASPAASSASQCSGPAGPLSWLVALSRHAHVGAHDCACTVDGQAMAHPAGG